MRSPSSPVRLGTTIGGVSYRDLAGLCANAGFSPESRRLNNVHKWDAWFIGSIHALSVFMRFWFCSMKIISRTSRSRAALTANQISPVRVTSEAAPSVVGLGGGRFSSGGGRLADEHQDEFGLIEGRRAESEVPLTGQTVYP